MKQKIKDKIQNTIEATITKASLNQFKPETIKKITKAYLKFIQILYKIITGVTLTFAFVYFFPIYLNRGYEFSIIILLIIIIYHLRYGTTDIRLK